MVLHHKEKELPNMVTTKPKPPENYPTWLDYATRKDALGFPYSKNELTELRYQNTMLLNQLKFETDKATMRKELAVMKGKLEFATNNAAELAKQRDERLFERNDVLNQFAKLEQKYRKIQEEHIELKLERDTLRAAASDILLSFIANTECRIPHHQVERLFKAVHGQDAKTPWDE